MRNGMVFAFTESQIDQIIARYEYLTGVFFFFVPFFPFFFRFVLFFLPLSLSLGIIMTRVIFFLDLRSQGRNMTASLGWLIGAVMPLDAVGNVHNLETVMNGCHI